MYSPKKKDFKFQLNKSNVERDVFSLSHTCDKMKKIFLYFFTKPQTNHLFLYKHDTNDIANEQMHGNLESICFI